MKALILAVSASALTAAIPASAQVLTLGGSLAESCYVSALERDSSFQAIRTCNRAFVEQGLTRDDAFATHVNRGIVLMIRGDLAGARADFTRAAAMKPNRSEPWLNMAILRFNQGDSAGSIELFSRAIELGTNKPAIAYYGRGLAHEDAGNLNAAYADLRRAVSLQPGWAEPARELARYQVRQR